MPTFRQDTKIGGMVPMMKTDDYNDQSVTEEKLKDGAITTRKIAGGSVTKDKLDSSIRQEINDSVTASNEATEKAKEATAKADQATENAKQATVAATAAKEAADTATQLATNATTASAQATEQAKAATTKAEESAAKANEAAQRADDSREQTEQTLGTMQGVISNITEEQKRVGIELEKKFDKESVVQESGEAEDKVMSQKAVSDKLSDLCEQDILQDKYLSKESVSKTIESQYSNEAVNINLKRQTIPEYNVSKVITLEAGDMLVAHFTCGDNLAAIAETTHENGYGTYTKCIELGHNSVDKDYFYVANIRCFVVLSYKGEISAKVIKSGTISNIYNSIDKKEDAGVYANISSAFNEDKVVSKLDSVIYEKGWINEDGTIKGTNSDYYWHSKPISVKKGDVLYFSQYERFLLTPDRVAIAEIVDGQYKPLLVKDSNYFEYNYYFNKDCEISLGAIISLNKTPAVRLSNAKGLVSLYNIIQDETEIRKKEVAELQLLPDKRLHSLDINYKVGNIDANGKFINGEYLVSYFIPISEINTMILSLKNDMSAIVHFYDKNRKWLGRDSRITKEDASRTYYFGCMLNEPKMLNCKYIRIVALGSDESLLSVIFTSNSHFYNNPIVINNGNLLVCAHAGISTREGSQGHRKEGGNNLLSSLLGAYQEGFDVFLCNQVFSKDGVCYCNHEGSFTDSITSKTINIAEHTSAEIDACRYDGERLPKLDEVIFLSKLFGMKLFIVNAGDNYDLSLKYGETIAKIIQKYKMWDNCILMARDSSADYYRSLYAKCNIAICQNPVSSTEYSSISALYEEAKRLQNNMGDTYIWIPGYHPLENIIKASTEIPYGVKLGAFTIDKGKELSVAPYLNIYSSNYESFGQSRAKLIAFIKTKFPDILNNRPYLNI